MARRQAGRRRRSRRRCRKPMAMVRVWPLKSAARGAETGASAAAAPQERRGQRERGRAKRGTWDTRYRHRSLPSVGRMSLLAASVSPVQNAGRGRRHERAAARDRGVSSWSCARTPAWPCGPSPAPWSRAATAALGLAGLAQSSAFSFNARLAVEFAEARTIGLVVQELLHALVLAAFSLSIASQRIELAVEVVFGLVALM